MSLIIYVVNDFNSKIYLDRLPYKKFIVAIGTLYADTLNTVN
ncbi:hypothetical protein Asal01_03027 [Fodinibius salicampi]